MSKVIGCLICECDIEGMNHQRECPNHPDNLERPDAAPPKEDVMECEHHFHQAPWTLLTDPPQGVDICCLCGERRPYVLWPNARLPIPESCGKFHPERPGHAGSASDQAAPPSDAAQPLPDGWVSCPPIQYAGREYAIVWQQDRPFLCCRINDRWMVEHAIGHPEDAPEGPWIDFCDLNPQPEPLTIGVTTRVIGGLFEGQEGKTINVDYGTRKARLELDLNRLKGEE